MKPFVERRTKVIENLSEKLWMITAVAKDCPLCKYSDVVAALTMEIDCLRYQDWWIKRGIFAIEAAALSSVITRFIGDAPDRRAIPSPLTEPFIWTRPHSKSLDSQLREGFMMLSGDVDPANWIHQGNRHRLAPSEMDFWRDNF